MKKRFLIPSIIPLLFPNIAFAAPCADGVNADGCTISSTQLDYTLTGDIETAPGVKGIEFQSGATGNATTLTGNITTSGDSAYGLYLLSSPSNTTSLIGNITTSGASAHGIYLFRSDSNTTTLTGDISTTGSDTYGIHFYDSESNTTTLTGDISTEGTDAYGLYFLSSDSNITSLTGDISTKEDDVHGFYLFDSDSSTSNLTGDISTVGDDAHGLRLYSSDSNTTTLIGNITTSGANAHGFYLYNSHSNTTSLTGDISTEGDDAHGIFFDNGTSNTMTMSGNITSTGNNNYGFYINTQTSSSITMSGDITLSDGYGMFITNSDSNTLTMNGDITSTSGDYAIGAYFVNSDSNSLTVGNISSVGTTSGSGINLNDSDSNTININGKVSASGGNNNAIVANSTSDNNTFTLNQGSVIDGRLYNDGSNNTLKLNLGAGRSYALETTGSSNWTIEDLNNRPMVTGSAYGIGVGNIETQGHEMYQRTYQVNQTLQQRQLANYKGNASPYWINSYYNKSSRSGSSNLSSNNLQFSNHRSGINLGYRVTKYEQPIELLFNYESSSMNHDDFNHQISSDSMMAGVFIPNIKQIAGGELSVNAMLGISDFRGSRKVMTNSSGYSGIRTIGSDYQAKHYVVGASWLKELHKGEVIQSYLNLGADINHQQMQSYREEAYYKFNSRDITQLQSRITLSADAQPFKNKLNINVNLGIENRNMIAGTQQGLYLNNTKSGYSHVNQTNTYLTTSLNMSYPFTNTISAYAGYQYFDSGDDIKMSSGQIGISGSF